MKTFKNILAFQKEFSTDEKCREYLEQQRWNSTPACPSCGSINVCRFSNSKIFKCREKQCRNKFSVTVGTIYENTKIPLTNNREALQDERFAIALANCNGTLKYKVLTAE